MRTSFSVWISLMAFIKVSNQQCTIEGSSSIVKDTLFSTGTITINSTYYNCLSRSDTSDQDIVKTVLIKM